MFRFALLAALVCAGFGGPAFGQTFTWNNTGADWATSANWDPPGGPPTGNGVAQFNVLGTFGTGPINQPTWSSSPAGYGVLRLSSTAQFTGWNFESAGTLTQFGFRADGPVTHTFNGASLAGPAPPGNSVAITIANGATVAFTGTSVVNSFIFGVNLFGGTLRLDNTTININNRLSNSAGLTFQGGTLDLQGNSTGTAFTVGALSGASTSGVNTIRLTPGGGPLSVNFNNTGTDFSTRLSSFSVFRVAATSGVLGGPGANDPKMTFTGTPALGANGLLAAVAGGANVGYFTVLDANGTDFATWNATNGVKAAGATLTSSNATGAGSISTGTANSRVFFTPGAGTQSATGFITNGSLRITPTATGGTLAMGANNLDTVALMLNGDKDFAISSSGVLAGGVTPRYIHVNDANTTLTTSLVIVSSSTGATNIVGPGFVVLNSGTSQNTATNARINLLGGTLRANNTQIGFSNTGGGSLVFAGGVLEIQGGGTITRTLNAFGGQGTVHWEGGSGGFSAFGANATVNIGGASAPMMWASGGFVQDGYALKFGSTKSNATVMWQNPIVLDGGTPGNYLVREINVTKGVGNMADHTIISGAITGTTSTDLLKTGTGVLALNTINTYQGNTLIHGGTLVLSGSGATLGQSGGPFTGNVVVGKGAVLAGSGFVNPDVGNNKSVVVNPGGAIRGGDVTSTSSVEHTGTLTIMSNVTINSTSTDRGTIQFEANRSAPSEANSSRIALGAGSNLNLNPGSGNQFVIELVKTTLTSSVIVGEAYTVTIASVGAGGAIQLNGVTLSDGVIPQSNYTFVSSSFVFDSSYSLAVANGGTELALTFMPVPVPEPATVLGLAAGVLGLGTLVRRRVRAARVAAS